MNYFESSKETLKKKKKNFEEKDDYNDLIDRYEVNDIDEKTAQTSFFFQRLRKKNYLPFIFYIFLLTILLFLGLFFFTIFKFLNADLNYISYDNQYEKPSISNYNYTKLEFKNGLEVLLVQTGENRMAAGTITFDASYLDSRYKFGYIYLFFSIITMNILDNENLYQYVGNYKISQEENSFSFYFEILNAGFFKYLETLKSITFLENNDKRFNEDKVKNITAQTIQKIKNPGNINIEDYILKYFIYGFQNLLPKNNNNFLNNIEIDEIKNISESLLKPDKIKIVLSSHFKPSLMKKKFLNYFKNIANAKKEEQSKALNNSTKFYEDKYFSKQKIIYFKVDNGKENYIKINYYIDKNKNESYEEFYEKQGYFNYLKYILDESSEGSLIHLLTNNSDYTIKYLSSQFKIILKDKIEFSIKIHLTPSCYKYLGDIIFLTYQYMNKLIKHINKSTSDDERLKELKTIINQNFTFIEDDTHDIMSFIKNLGENLCDKKNKKLFLKIKWMPSFDYEDIKNYKYFSQLIPENSVIILALSDNNKEIFVNNNSKFKFNISQFINSTIEFYNINFRYFNFDVDFKKYFNENETTIPFNKNNYISIYEKQIDKDEKDIKDFDHHSISIKNTSINNFTFIRDTSFGLPRVHISLNLLHPFLRPSNQSYFRDCLFIESVLYIAFIDREIKFKLADAIRAGNKIKVELNQNHMFIEVFVFSDVAEKIIRKIKEIMMDKNSFEEIHNNINKFELYKHYAYENYLLAHSIKGKVNYLFYSGLNEEIYNKRFDLQLNDIEKCHKDTKNKDINKLMTNFLIDGQIYGYYDKNQAEIIANLFNDRIIDESDFSSVLDIAGLSNKNLNSNVFRKWIRKINLEDKSSNITIKITNNTTKNRYIYIYWDNYNLTNRAKSFIFKKITNRYIQHSNEYKFNLDFFYYNNIYMVFNLNYKNSENFPKYNTTEIIKQLIEIIEKTLNNTNIKKYYETDIDSIGSRLYYLIKNMIEIQYIKAGNMISSAINHLFSELYDANNFRIFKEESKELKENNYNLILNFISNISYKYYIDIY